MKIKFTRCDLGAYFIHEEETFGEKRCWYDGSANDIDYDKEYEVNIIYHSLFSMEPWKSCMGWTNLQYKTIEGLIEKRNESVETYRAKRLADHKRNPSVMNPLSKEEENIRGRFTIHPYCKI